MSTVHHFNQSSGEFNWEGVEPIHLDSGGIVAATKHILIGQKEGAPHFIMRYIELAPGGHSSLERHPHEHEVIVLRGEGVVQIGDEKHAIKPFDTIFVAGDALHQFTNPHKDPFGFICVIPKLDD